MVVMMLVLQMVMLMLKRLMLMRSVLYVILCLIWRVLLLVVIKLLCHTRFLLMWRLFVIFVFYFVLITRIATIIHQLKFQNKKNEYQTKQKYLICRIIFILSLITSIKNVLLSELWRESCNFIIRSWRQIAKKVSNFLSISADHFISFQPNKFLEKVLDISWVHSL